MTVKELINKLQSYPTDVRVVVEGYEGGYDDIDITRQISIKLNVNKEWYYGTHEESEKKNVVHAILLAGKNKNCEDNKL